MVDYIKAVLENMPSDWLNLTTHRLDIYNEGLAKVEFLEGFEGLFQDNNADQKALNALPTAYDYIRLGHPLSSVLEWAIAKQSKLKTEQVISFSSKTMPILAVLRRNLFEQKNTQIAYTKALPACFDAEVLRTVYGYRFELTKVKSAADIPAFEGSTVFVSEQKENRPLELPAKVDFFVRIYDADLGSVLLVNGQQNEAYVPDIQHVRRRETIAMTPANCVTALRMLVGLPIDKKENHLEQDKAAVISTIKEITGTQTKALLASSGLSTQYAIMMGLIDDALEKHQGKAIKIIVPPNCYGGTNDQSRRVAAGIENAEVVDLPVDGEHNMVQSIDLVLDRVAKEDAVPYIIAEIPTNPRVEVPDLLELREVLTRTRKTASGTKAIDPVFILDQTFCPNVQFLGEDKILSTVRTIAYVSGSKFPSGGKCTAGYCVANKEAEALLEKIEKHLKLCDNEATHLQVEILAQQMPSMNQRIEAAYKNTRAFVNFIKETLPTAKINFVSEELAQQGFTPSVFSLDLPTQGDTHEAREAYKRALNQKLINRMINEIPQDSKYCVSYGQLKGCYWTIPATSTQGTTKEDDKDYIARVSVSPDLDLAKHQEVFLDFVKQL